MHLDESNQSDSCPYPILHRYNELSARAAVERRYKAGEKWIALGCEGHYHIQEAADTKAGDQ